MWSQIAASQSSPVHQWGVPPVWTQHTAADRDTGHYLLSRHIESTFLVVVSCDYTYRNTDHETRVLSDSEIVSFAQNFEYVSKPLGIYSERGIMLYKTQKSRWIFDFVLGFLFFWCHKFSFLFYNFLKNRTTRPLRCNMITQSFYDFNA